MSFPPPRPTSTTPTPQSNGSHGPTHATSSDSNGASSSAQNLAQSPIDWANFINFQTPPVSGNSSSGRTPGDQYKSFAQGIASSRPSPPTPAMNFQQPYSQVSPPGRTAQTPRDNQYVPVPSPLQHQLQLPAQSSMPARSPTSNPDQGMGKGKSTARAPSNPQSQQLIQNAINPLPDSNNPDNGLTLDPAAFSRDIRFQVPPFLSNQMGGAPTFPPGGEAWSGFSGANFFGNDGSGQGGQLTPGAMFSQSMDGQYNEASGGGRNVLEGLSGFMSGENSWDNWGNDQKPDVGGGLGTTFYVNPNPTPSVLASRNAGQPNTMGGYQRPSGQNFSQGRPNTSQHNMQTAQMATPMQSPRTGSTSQPQMMNNGMGSGGQQRPGNMATAPDSNSMSTSTILAHQPFPPHNFPYTPSSTAAMSHAASTVNIASSSSAPYAPPSNTQALLSGPSMTGPSLADGPGLYSTTGFDMVGVLSRVAARKDPKTVLGPVDLSCSFLVVDIRRYDSPIVYASPTFTSLTGYDLPQILGRNCRFLQSPDSDVVKGSKRKYTDNVAVAHLKRMLNAGKECQASLINYRRGGIPFINLVTVVPIPWDGTDIVYHVGFQVDLVEQPNAILRNMKDGSYQVNYTVTNPPQPPLRPAGREVGITGLGAEIMEVMGERLNLPGFGLGEDGAKMEWLKMALENADDFIHVLSLKGQFQYASPSVRRVLEYHPDDLINKNISDICHPSDIVPLMRELKDSTHAPVEGQSARPVNLVFRIRRKSSGYVWIECTGRLHVEPGKGRKAVILSGRARSVPTLPWDSVARHGGLADNEFWAKVSFHGLMLHATSSVGDLLGQPAEDVVGQSFFSLLPGGDNGPPSAALVETDPSAPVASLASALRSAVNGETRHGAVSLRHKMVKKSGTQVEVVSVLYPPRGPTGHSPRSDSDDSSPSSYVSSQHTSGSSSVSGTKSAFLVIQVKLLPTSDSRPVVHAANANVFEELETTRGTSWQYELHQLRMLNRRLKEDVAAARARSGIARGKGKKRKVSDEGVMAPPPLPPVPDHFAAAPRHQLAPGFGLVGPGMQTSYYRVDGV